MSWHLRLEPDSTFGIGEFLLWAALFDSQTVEVHRIRIVEVISSSLDALELGLSSLSRCSVRLNIMVLYVVQVPALRIVYLILHFNDLVLS